MNPIIKCGVKLPIHFRTSTVQFENRNYSSHTSCARNYVSMLGFSYFMLVKRTVVPLCVSFNDFIIPPGDTRGYHLLHFCRNPSSLLDIIRSLAAKFFSNSSWILALWFQRGFRAPRSLNRLLPISQDIAHVIVFIVPARLFSRY